MHVERHRTGHIGWLRAAVLGANDGLISTSSLVVGVAASGTGTLTYQWRRSGTAISGATAASYATPALTLADNGASFSVDVTDTHGTTSSNVATVTVQAVAPNIATAPENQTVTAGQSATFSVTATGSATLAYQWRRDGADIAGANAATYTLPAAAAADDGESRGCNSANTFSCVSRVWAVFRS